MPLATVYTRAQHGLSAPLVTAEVQLSGGLPGLAIVGLVETAVRESRERVRAAIRHAGFDVPRRKITVNLAPADLPKAGSRFDLAIAVGILAASGQIPDERLADHEFFGELGFSGSLRPVSALLPSLVQAAAQKRRCIIPAAGATEAMLVGNAAALLAGHLSEVVRYLVSGEGLQSVSAFPAKAREPAAGDDLDDVRGQFRARRALEIAAAGGHNLLFIGPPGAGKTMLARRMPGLLPPLTGGERLEVAMIRSLAGVMAGGVPSARPFRAPHHSATTPALVGGGRPPRPGEISLAHCGVLYLDELPEFRRDALEALRQPLESGRVTIARVDDVLEFPADFQLIATMNPCPCGFYGDRQRECRCTPDQVRRYQGRISGPFLDRIDVIVQLNREAVSLEHHGRPDGEASAVVAERVARARDAQLQRSGVPNAELPDDRARATARPDRDGRCLLERAAERFALSQRVCNRVLRVARTIADLRGGDAVTRDDVAEAVSFQSPGGPD